ncbi:hypothetical protein S2091_2870 [Solimicrobium silvestre]|uniref:Uncharacterized protein n=1 Tax=Solimicrobium silvestre TaxID=2099400 RepID=A0A2S9GXP6_9BURK|nr:hypothetical protein S2091_2870 [Solimicrobium silvestre]
MKLPCLTVISALVLSSCSTVTPVTSTTATGTNTRLALLETTDIHANLRSYD